MMEMVRKLDRLQQQKGFKIAMTIAVVLLAILAVVWQVVAASKAAQMLPEAQMPSGLSQPIEAPKSADPAEVAMAAKAEQERRDVEMTVRLLNELRAARFSSASVITGIAAAVGVSLVVIWLGLALTYLAILLAGSVVALPPLALGLSNTSFILPAESLTQLGWFISGGLTLAAAFTALVRFMGAVLSASHPITAVARNVLAEAVRMKISLVFIVLLIMLMASLPGLLDQATPLRYRVQTFLQYSTAGSFTLIAALAIFLGTATVCFEQRDKIIWQTATKPVRPWEYVAGKWLGVATVCFILLSVCGLGIYMFTEYLRQRPAIGEVAAFIPREQDDVITEDRLVLEYQVLVGRASERFTVTEDKVAAIRDAALKRYEEEDRIYREETKKSSEPPDRNKIIKEVQQEMLAEYLAIEPGNSEKFTFTQLQQARKLGKPLTLRYTVNAGGNLPSELYRITIWPKNQPPMIREIHLGQPLTLSMPASFVDPTTGDLELRIYNADYVNRSLNAETISFPPDGLEITFPVVSFGENFLRVLSVNAMKLAFLSMVGVVCGTFLAFPVANLVAFGVFICAESAPFLREAVTNMRTEEDGQIIWWAWTAEKIAIPIAEAFRFYGDLRPVGSLVEGRILPGDDIFGAAVVLLSLTAILFVIGSAIFRSRELATYSGQ